MQKIVKWHKLSFIVCYSNNGICELVIYTKEYWWHVANVKSILNLFYFTDIYLKKYKKYTFLVDDKNAYHISKIKYSFLAKYINFKLFFK